MTWQQLVIAAWFMLNIAFVLISTARNTKISSGVATVTVMLYVALYAGLSAVLHAGGFW